MKLNTNRIPGLVLTDHTFQLPLNYAEPNGEKIEVFGREVVAVGKENKNLPWLVFFQGGPGFASPRPLSDEGWLKVALQDHRVFFLDDRGTGRSTPICAQTLSGKSPKEQAEVLTHFRADNIVRDAEMIRKELVQESWSALGQSYGGFCIMTYLSMFPEGLREAYITGGVPSTHRHVDEVYSETYRLTKTKNEIYYQRYPEDERKVVEIVDYLEHNDVFLPNGDRLSGRYFQCLGLNFGFQVGYETIHNLIEHAFVTTHKGRELSYFFLKSFMQVMSFDTNPIFSLLHEAIYAQGFATLWSAHRVRESFPEFSINDDRILFTGEMIFPWMFDEISELKPLKEAAQILAEKSDWSFVYDESVLKKNTVPVTCAVYYNDMFVTTKYSQETIDMVPNMQSWTTSEFEHCGIRTNGTHILQRLMDLSHGKVY